MNNLMAFDKKPAYALAFDKSVRSVDVDGRLHVAVSNLSKATVNPYLGKEIPNHSGLGLDPEKIYNLFRDPEELKKGAHTFNNIPLLSKHVPISADDHKPDLVVGSTGTDAVFESPYLKNSLVVWESVAIGGIETRDQCELSCAYRYIPIMEAGTFEGMPYDGRMTGIIGNHVALVEIGRAGSDVVVADENPFINNQEGFIMTRKDKLVIAHAAAIKIAQDAGISKKELAKLLGLDAEAVSKLPDEPKLKANDAEKLEGETDEEYAERMKALKASDEQEEEEAKKKKAESASDAEEDAKEEKKKDDGKAMDAAVKRIQAISAAEKDVRSVIGDVVAQDSAEAVYKLALDHLGVATEGVHPSALKALFSVAKGIKKPAVAQDGALSTAAQFAVDFPSAVIPKRG
jgi:hypothetical protein